MGGVDLWSYSELQVALTKSTNEILISLIKTMLRLKSQHQLDGVKKKNGQDLNTKITPPPPTKKHLVVI